jgi:hypothetical protein
LSFSVPQIERHGPGMPFIDPSRSIPQKEIEYRNANRQDGKILQFNQYTIKDNAESYLCTLQSGIIPKNNYTPHNTQIVPFHSYCNIILLDSSTVRVSNIGRKIFLLI